MSDGAEWHRVALSYPWDSANRGRRTGSWPFKQPVGNHHKAFVISPERHRAFEHPEIILYAFHAPGLAEKNRRFFIELGVAPTCQRLH